MSRRIGPTMRQSGRRVIVGMAVIAVLGGLSIAGFVLHLEHHGKTVDVVSLVSMFIGLLGALIALAQLIVAMASSAGPVSRTVQLEHAMAELAEAVRVQWERETIVRALRNPLPIQVRWSTAVATEDQTPDADSASRQRNSGRTTGRLRDVTQKFLDLPHRQLFIIGVPGSGKTAAAVLFTLSLLNLRAAEEAVPVLLSPVGWDPGARSFQEWMGDEILAHYPALGETARYGERASYYLIATGRILPVIDGLDEISEHLRATVLNGIAAEWGDRPIVLTCRTEEYKTITKAGRALGGSTTIYLKPVSQTERIAYLNKNGKTGNAGRWQPLIEHMQQNPRGQVAKALSTPLMMNLVYTVYVGREDVVELIDASSFPDRESIERHLLDSFIDIAYSNAPMPPMLGTHHKPANRGQQSSEKARAWLAEIARSLDRSQTRDFAWWLLYRTIPWGRVRFGFVAIITIIGALAAFLVVDFIFPIGTTLIATLIIGVASMAAAVIGARFGTIPGLPVRAAARIRVDTDRLERKAPFILGVLPGIPIGVLVSFALGPTSGVYCGMVTAMIGALLGGLGRWSLPADNAVAVSAFSSLAHDRRATVFHIIAVGISFGTVVGVTSSAHHGPVVGVYCALIAGIAFGVVVSAGSAYAWFVATRAWLAVTGRLPWRLMGFLDDAYRRGLLRQNGAVYQFRHVRLQERLALPARSAVQAHR